MIRMNKKIRLSLLVSFIIVAFTGCLKTDNYEDTERLNIETYLSEHVDVQFDLKSSGLYYADIVIGTGKVPVAHDTAYIFYDAQYLSENSFGSNFGTTDTLVAPVGEGFLILGFDEAITYMAEGGKAKAIVPSNLGYGNSGYFFPAYTPILFDIHLVKVKPGPGAR